MNDLQDKVAQELGITREQVVQVLEMFALETHRSFYELRHDPIGELRWNTSAMAFFHFLGVFRSLAEIADGEFHPEEYLLRMGTQEDWQPFSSQMATWKRPEER
jgi:hypothetical protein